MPVGCPVGTTIEVRNLFFNTPVRHKFLRTTQTEMGHTTEALTRLALAHPRVHFTLTHNGRLVHDLPPVDDVRHRVATFFGQEIADDLIEIESESDGVTLCGFVANPMHSRASGRMQYLFLNGRAIRDRSLQHALGEAYRGLLLTGRQPICFLRLEMPPELVDVNVHPTKQEVRFQDGGRLYSQLLGTLRTKFLTTDLTARGKSPANWPAADGDEAREAAGDVSQLVHWAKEQLGQQPRAATSLANGASPGGEPLRLHRLDVPPFQRFDAPHPETVPREDVRVQPTGAAAPRGALQVHNRYLVVENDAGLEVIDQHALHERILYEQLRDKVLAGALESQRLLGAGAGRPGGLRSGGRA